MRWKHFGTRLNTVRQQAGLTQEHLADLLTNVLGAEISQQSIAQWCRGQHRPADRRTLLALCSVLYTRSGVTTLASVNQLLQAADQGAVHPNEIELWFPDLPYEVVPQELHPQRQRCLVAEESARIIEYRSCSAVDVSAKDRRDGDQTNVSGHAIGSERHIPRVAGKPLSRTGYGNVGPFLQLAAALGLALSSVSLIGLVASTTILGSGLLFVVLPFWMAPSPVQILQHEGLMSMAVAMHLAFAGAWLVGLIAWITILILLLVGFSIASLQVITPASLVVRRLANLLSPTGSPTPG